MPLSAPGLSAAIKAKLVARGWFNNDADGQAFCDDLAGAIVAYLVANTSVIPTLLVAPGGGGPVTGTGTIL